MNKFTLSLIGLSLGGVISGYAMEKPVEIPNVYTTKITSDGTYVGNFGASSSTYNTQTGELVMYEDCILGLGNSVSATGVAVGYMANLPVVMANGVGIVPEPFRQSWLGNMNGITSDGSILTGYINNPKLAADQGLDVENFDEAMMVPFYVEMDADGKVGEMHILPFPEKDFFGNVPQMVLANWISDDGNVIAGQYIEATGRLNEPIIFKRGSDGEWSYTLPTKDLFNPDGIVLPENPWLSCPPIPDVINFMSPESAEAYIQAHNEYLNGELPFEPDPFEYMTIEEEEEFNKAADEYISYINDHAEEINTYEETFQKIVASTPTFSLNDVAMDAAGKTAAYACVKDTGDASILVTYVFNLEDSSYKVIESELTNIAPKQILSDGTIVSASNMSAPAQTYLYFADADDYVSVLDYLKENRPGCAEWIEETLANGSGNVVFSDDMSIFAGGVTYQHFTVQPYFVFESYVFAPESGVEEIIAPEENGVYTVYNLQGVKVAETKDASVLQTLPKGLYIVNGKKVAL